VILNRPARWACVALAASLLGASTAAASPATEAQPAGTTSVLFVGNNWDGTADVIDPKTFQKVAHFNVVPDLEERMNEIYTNPVRLGYFLAIRQLIGEGNDQFVDDMFSSHDGRFVFVSRPSLADVVAIDLKAKQIAWRFPMEGQRSDHMAISPDRTRLLVSDSTANKVQELDTATGKKVGEFPSGDTPHESNYSADGTRIFHASIGTVYTPTDEPAMDTSKGERVFQIVQAGTNRILQRWDIGQLLRDNGFGDYSSAVRPMAISPDEKTAYLQLSFLHGFVVFDLVNGKPLKVVDLPKVTTEPRENYLLDSAHHGLSINPSGTKLCAAGTMDGYAALISTKDFTYKLFDGVDKPYWSTNSGDGRYCFVSASGADKVVVLDYAAEKRVAEIPVGDHPQRMRMGLIRSEYVGRSLQPSPARPAKALAGLQVRRAVLRNGRLRLTLRVRRGATGRIAGRFAGRGFSVRIPRSGVWRASVPARARGGALRLVYKGDAATTADRVRLHVGRRGAALRRTATRVDSGGRLTVRGTIARRARGAVRVGFTYLAEATRHRTLTFRAPIRRGRWAVVNRLLPTLAAQRGGLVTVTYAGHARRGVTGARIASRLKP
jgi:YVTN family beta-propeller protein